MQMPMAQPPRPSQERTWSQVTPPKGCSSVENGCGDRMTATMLAEARVRELVQKPRAAGGGVEVP